MARTESILELTTKALSRGADNGHGPDQRFLSELGQVVRAFRQRRKISRKALSESSGVSQRFIAQLEAGEGNISIMRLKSIADVLGVPMEAIIALRDEEEVADAYRLMRPLPSDSISQIAQRAADISGTNKVALIGLRGAGKTTLGRRVAENLGVRFVELNTEIERLNGLAVSEIFALYGEPRYRQLEREALAEITKDDAPLILAIAGGIVEHSESYECLLRSFVTVWLQASPDEHMARVLAQGDRRPVAGHPAAMDHLREILRARETAYARAHFALDTSGRKPEQSEAELMALIEPRLRIGI
ncbi:MAG: helix-turn-helix transcriptional regulator [Pseudomonadota bacterium]